MKLFKFGKGLKEGALYACSAGYWAGHSFIYITSNEDEWGFLELPKMTNVWISKEKFDFGLKNDIIEYVERVPRAIRTVCKKQFDENKKERKGCEE